MEKAFSACISLQKVDIKEGVQNLGKEAFRHCYSLLEANIPSSIRTIGENAFAECHERLTIQVEHESIGLRYCIENNINYTYPDADSWLTD